MRDFAQQSRLTHLLVNTLRKVTKQQKDKYYVDILTQRQ